MCGRFAFTQKDPAKIKKRFKVKEITFDLTPLFNITPDTKTPVILNTSPEKLDLVKWGLVRRWSKDESFKMINARAETVAEKPMFNSLLKDRRCLVISDTFYEWRKGLKFKTPYRIYLKNEEPFAMAGLWDEREGVKTYTILTTSANDLVKPIHDRMPVILDEKSEDLWLTEKDLNKILSLLTPFPHKMMACYPITSAVNAPQNNSEELWKRI